MKKIKIILLLLMATWVQAQDAAPDLDKMLASAKASYTPVETLDVLMIQLRYFDQHTPTPEQEKKLLEVLRTIANAYSLNIHYKKGYAVFEKYLSRKEKMLAREKAAAISTVSAEHDRKNATDENQVGALQGQVHQLNSDISSLKSMRSNFKTGFSVIIVVLTLLFAASLFRTGMRLKNMLDEIKTKRELMMEQHRIATLGKLDSGVSRAIGNNREAILQGSTGSLEILSKANQSEFIRSISARLKEIQKTAAEMNG